MLKSPPIANLQNDSLYLTNISKPLTKEEYLNSYYKATPKFKPNEKTEYANSNYILLGYIIEQLYKKNYKTVLEEKITNPLKLKNTDVKQTNELKDNQCSSYSFINNQWKIQEETNSVVLGAAGNIVSTPFDLNTFIQQLFSYKLINQSSLEQMKTINQGFGMGLLEIPYYKRKGYGHTGGIDGFRSTLIYFPDDSVSICYLSNGEVYPKDLIVYGLLNIYYNKPYTMPVFTKFNITVDELDKYLGLYRNAEIPLDIKITKNGISLIAQATAQPSFDLEAFEIHKFKSEKVGVQLIFNPIKQEMTLNQRGQNIIFKKVTP
ncbi:MAG: serine hydrolase domain-containing protein [Bacteroidota bacterium]